MASARKYELCYFTATILEWKHLLTNDMYKDIIIGSLRFFVEKERVFPPLLVFLTNNLAQDNLHIAQILRCELYLPHNGIGKKI